MNFYLICNEKKLIKNPLKKSVRIAKNIEEYLMAIHKISESRLETTSNALKNYFKLTRESIFYFFKNNNIIKQYVNIIIGTPPIPNKYILTNKGKKAVSLILHFRDYYIKNSIII
ncbi:MAG: hypothetical protein KGD57_07170 [Candidatus Lokiarchaeota archaeon]|nr:hypothetical protein [Candidatus Lokiarchaeota archaeon]